MIESKLELHRYLKDQRMKFKINPTYEEHPKIHKDHIKTHRNDRDNDGSRVRVYTSAFKDGGDSEID